MFHFRETPCSFGPQTLYRTNRWWLNQQKKWVIGNHHAITKYGKHFFGPIKTYWSRLTCLQSIHCIISIYIYVWLLKYALTPHVHLVNICFCLHTKHIRIKWPSLHRFFLGEPPCHQATEIRSCHTKTLEDVGPTAGCRGPPPKGCRLESKVQHAGASKPETTGILQWPWHEPGFQYYGYHEKHNDMRMQLMKLN